MKLRKGLVPLLLFAALFAGWLVYTAMNHERVPMEGASTIAQP